jgi:hypothetical protein
MILLEVELSSCLGLGVILIEADKVLLETDVIMILADKSLIGSDGILM